jgi:hypothetical protein
VAAISRPEGSELMHTFSDSYTLGKFNPRSYANWLAELRALFPVPDEFLLADAIFSFPNAFKEGRRRNRPTRGSIFSSARRLELERQRALDPPWLGTCFSAPRRTRPDGADVLQQPQRSRRCRRSVPEEAGAARRVKPSTRFGARRIWSGWCTVGAQESQLRFSRA